MTAIQTARDVAGCIKDIGVNINHLLLSQYVMQSGWKLVRLSISILMRCQVCLFDHTLIIVINKHHIRIAHKKEYEALSKKLPEKIDWSLLSSYEEEDNTVAMQTLACSGDVCEIVDLT